ncbi:MAG: sulfatase [Planctomycetaceae bacterium]|jgi:arylsulfatase A-like enzyme|nr:sulfatase [Planctomycetaceae bacterium]
MKHILFLFAFAYAAGCCFTTAFAADTPNVIVIFIDDMGYADIGPFGSETPTPNLDRMAAEGRRFTNFTVSSGVCSASRSALMTGCIHWRVNINGALPPNSQIGLNPDEETIAEVLKKKGYATAIFGKWHLGDKPEFLPPNQGFDEYFGLPYSNDMWNRHPDVAKFPEQAVNNKRKYPPLTFIEGTKPVSENLTPEDQKTLTTRYTERAVQFIEKHKDAPFFLYVPHNMVHVPLFVSDKFAGKSGKGLFGDVVMELDWSVGQILEAVRKNGLDKKTLVVFTADNGPWLNFGNHAGSAKPLREGKGTSWEGGVREPAIFWYPGKIPANTVCNELVSTVDILPTAAALAGAPLPEKKIDGKDIRPLLFGEKGAVSPHTAFPIYFNRQLQAVRDNRWKLILPHQYRTMEGQELGKDGSPGQYIQKKTGTALYDLLNDVSETADVSAQHPEIVKRLQAAADEIRAELGEGDNLGPGVRPAGKHIN